MQAMSRVPLMGVLVYPLTNGMRPDGQDCYGGYVGWLWPIPAGHYS